MLIDFHGFWWIFIDDGGISDVDEFLLMLMFLFIDVDTFVCFFL